ncbi:hypothetical protein FJM67_05545 [Maribrevibacterium harenarium]|uniref:Carboxypeptidase regulatory-like domain-containing protein n=1 Tax=Maribrevibacterium harenarium TaxID=2589817 RepID=A0A501WX75_9GAMM|nr:hypothetical protein [Maribrevibacterium harenarium]TPE54078.1 hypothetical protein FJM67_05545 [Maribrevibacterium harenarium]
MIKATTFGVVTALALLSGKALAHYPTLDCYQETGKLHCVAGFSDGSPAYDETVEVRSYYDDVLHSITTDANGEFQIPMPEGEFYVIFDPGHESPAEFDYAEL